MCSVALDLHFNRNKQTTDIEVSQLEHFLYNKRKCDSSNRNNRPD